MTDFYLILVVILGLLAIADLVVGVSNDAVNFLNSAIGSKVVSFKTLMVIASLGVAFRSNIVKWDDGSCKERNF